MECSARPAVDRCVATRLPPGLFGTAGHFARSRSLEGAAETDLKPRLEPNRSHSKLVSTDVILKRVKQIEPLAIQVFASQLQPLLLNRCAVAGCHGPNPRSSYQLITARWTKTIPQNITLRNLYNSLQFVNFAKPEDSAILTLATSPHGGLKLPLVSLKQEPGQLKTLVNWVRIVTSTNPTSENNAGTERRLQSPIIFKANNFHHLDSDLGERVEIPEDTGLKDVSSISNESMKMPERHEDITVNPFSEPLENIKLSSDFDDLPLLTNKNGLLKVFRPPAVKNNVLTPNFDATFELPSNFIYKNRTPRDKSPLK